MQFKSFFFGVLFVGVSVAIPSPDTTVLTRTGGLCTKPNCISQCPDGTKYDCCVTYIRDPCEDHQKCKFEDCLCRCPNAATVYLCNANYLIDPCSTRPTSPFPTFRPDA